MGLVSHISARICGRSPLSEPRCSQNWCLRIIEIIILVIIGALTLSGINTSIALLPSGVLIFGVLVHSLSSSTENLLKRSPKNPLLFGNLSRHISVLAVSKTLLPSIHWLILGLFLPIGSVFPKGSLTLLVIIALLVENICNSNQTSTTSGAVTSPLVCHQSGDNGESSQFLSSPLSVFAPFVLVCLGWIIVAGYYEFPVFYIRDLSGLLISYPSSFFSIYKLAPVTFGLIESITPFLSILMIWGHLSTSSHKRDALFRGLMISWIFSLMWVGVQALGLTDWPQRRNAQFWLEQSRFWGTFSDPNSFGIFSTIVVSALASSQFRPRIKYPVLMLSFLLPLLSGSRSFVMGLAILGVAWIFERRNILKSELSSMANRWSLIWLGSVAAPLLLCFVVLFKPTSLQRIFLTLNPETAATSLFSRAVFWKSCLWIWMQYPVIGSGLGSFRDNFPQAVEHFGWNLNGWIDNANNFYLGILAELGLLGLVVFFLSIFFLKWREGCAGAVQRAPLVVVAILLFFGPHLEFMEVAVVVGFALSLTLRVDTKRIISLRRLGYVSYAIAGVCFMLTVLSDRGRDFGVFTPSRAHSVRLEPNKPVWIAPQASLVVRCVEGGLKLYISDERAVGVHNNRYFGGKDKKNRVVVSTDKESRSLELFNDSQIVNLSCSGELQRVSISSSTPWIPRLSRGGNDSRFLGVKVAQQF